MNDLKIFLVDDDAFYLNLLKQHLSNLGCEQISVFENGTDCLNQLQDNPDVVFLDYSMDALTGIEVLNKIKRNNPNIFVVMISAQDNIQPAVNSLKQGAFDYIEKGDDDQSKIKDVLQRIIEVKELLDSSKPSIFKRLFK
jgi:polysaccharide export outer membrane protein